jgi:hypothetical protein
MAPTKPLVEQQIRACHDVMGIPPSDTGALVTHFCSYLVTRFSGCCQFVLASQVPTARRSVVRRHQLHNSTAVATP